MLERRAKSSGIDHRVRLQPGAISEFHGLFSERGNLGKSPDDSALGQPPRLASLHPDLDTASFLAVQPQFQRLEPGMNAKENPPAHWPTAEAQQPAMRKGNRTPCFHEFNHGLPGG